MNLAATLRKSVRLMGHEATLYNRVSGTEDSFGDPTFTFSQVTVTVLLQSTKKTDEDFFTATGRQEQEIRRAFLAGDETVAVGDEIYIDAVSKRYSVKGIVDEIYRGEITYRRLFLQEMQNMYTTT